MATLDKTSVRDEVEKNRASFDKSSKTMSAEHAVLFNSMFMLIELILSVFLEKKTKKNGKNSSLPSSQTNKDDSSLSHPGTNGKGKNENKTFVSNTKVTESITVSHVDKCELCGEPLENVPSHKCERRTKVDIVFDKIIEHVDAEVKICPTCDSTAKGKFPADMPGPLQYGNGLKAFVINLLVCQMVALGRVQKLVKSMMGVLLSEATLLKFILRLHEALADWEASAIEQLLVCKAINAD